MRWPGIFLLLLTSLFCLHCQSADSLSRSEQVKLDRALQRLVSGEPLSIDQYTTDTREGETVYSVLIQTDDPERLRQSDLPVGSISGNTATARLTVDQIRTAATYPFVLSIANPERAIPQSNES